MRNCPTPLPTPVPTLGGATYPSTALPPALAKFYSHNYKLSSRSLIVGTGNIQTIAFVVNCVFFFWVILKLSMLFVKNFKFS